MAATVLSFSVEQSLAADSEALFAVISDPRRRPDWQSSLVRVHMLSQGEPRLGTRWWEETRGGFRFELEITTFEAPRRWAERAKGRHIDAEMDVRFESRGAATLLRVEVGVRLYGALRLLKPGIAAFLPGFVRADLRRAGVLALAN
jgi:Polyketide cyclase / dehydrase and lipid transport